MWWSGSWRQGTRYGVGKAEVGVVRWEVVDRCGGGGERVIFAVFRSSCSLVFTEIVRFGLHW